MECEKVRGYFTKEDEITKEKGCEEICGDGITVGRSYECDDGNLIDGDVCSSLCLVEEGFRCSGGNTTSPDLCKNVQPPILTFNPAYSHLSTHKFTFQADKSIKILNSTANPKSFVNVTILGKFSKYIFYYELEFVNLGENNTRNLRDEKESMFYNGITINLHEFFIKRK